MYTTPDTLIDEINRVLKQQGDRGHDIKSIEMDEDALKFFTKYWLPRTSYVTDEDGNKVQVNPKLNHQSFRIGDLVGSYRGVKVFCGHPGSVYFYDSLGHDVSKLVLKGFREVVMDLDVVFGKLKDVLGLDSDADELDVLIEVVRLVKDQRVSTIAPWPVTIGDPVPAPTAKPWTVPTITHNSDKVDDFRIPQHLLDRAEKVRSQIKSKTEEIYDARN